MSIIARAMVRYDWDDVRPSLVSFPVELFTYKCNSDWAPESVELVVYPIFPSAFKRIRSSSMPENSSFVRVLVLDDHEGTVPIGPRTRLLAERLKTVTVTDIALKYEYLIRMFRVKLDPSYPMFDPTDPSYVRNVTIVVGNHGDDTVNAHMFHQTNYPTGREHGQRSRAGQLNINADVQEFHELDVAQWPYAMKAQMAEFVDRGLIIVEDDTTGTLTGDNIRQY